VRKHQAGTTESRWTASGAMAVRRYSRSWTNTCPWWSSRDGHGLGSPLGWTGLGRICQRYPCYTQIKQ